MTIFQSAGTITDPDQVCDDVIDLILYRLELDDLATVSDTNARIRDIARSVFARKYGNSLISIDTFSLGADVHTNAFHMDEDLITYKDRPVIRVTKPRAWCKILRNFGESIKYIRLHYHKNISDRFWRHIVEHVSLYCTGSLRALEVFGCPSLPLDKPLAELHTFIATGWCPSYQMEALELMPNIRRLVLKTESLPLSMDKLFPNLETVELDFDGTENNRVHSLISFFGRNTQIKKLKLKICTIHGYSYSDLIYSTIIESLTQLNRLEITLGVPGLYRYGGDDHTNAETTVSTYQFKAIDTFGYRANNLQKREQFEFGDLKKLIVGPIRSHTETDVINFISSNRKLKVLKLTEIDLWQYSSSFARNFRQLLADLPELVEVIIQPATESSVEEIWEKAMSAEWKLYNVKECKNYRNNKKMTFTRKASKI